jgi:CheY-like chemotaxis protein
VARISHFLNHPVAIRSSLNRGSIFSILVPRAEHSNAPSAQRAEESAPSLAGLDILCIDDEPEVLFGMKALLEHWGAVVTTASSGIGIPAHEGRWSAIIADQLLPDETGISILRRMAGQADQRILLTATAEDGWDAELLAEGIQLLRKPAQPLQLRAMLGKPAVHASIEGSDTAATS